MRAVRIFCDERAASKWNLELLNIGPSAQFDLVSRIWVRDWEHVQARAKAWLIDARIDEFDRNATAPDP